MTNTAPHEPTESEQWDREGLRMLTLNWPRFFPTRPELADRMEHAYQAIVGSPELQQMWIRLFRTAQRIDTQSDSTFRWALEQHGNLGGFLRVLNESIIANVRLLDGQESHHNAVRLETFFNQPDHSYGEHLVRALRKLLHYGAMEVAVNDISEERSRDYIDYRVLLQLMDRYGDSPIPLDELISHISPTDSRGVPNQLLSRLQAAAVDGAIPLDAISEFSSGNIEARITIPEVDERIEELYADRLGLFDYQQFREREALARERARVRGLLMQWANATTNLQRREIGTQISRVANDNLNLLLSVLGDSLDPNSPADLELILALFGRYMRPM